MPGLDQPPQRPLITHLPIADSHTVLLNVQSVMMVQEQATPARESAAQSAHAPPKIAAGQKAPVCAVQLTAKTRNELQR